MFMADISNDIIMQAARGNVASFEKIYRAFSSFAYRVALRMVDDPLDAEEIVQDVFVRVYNQLKNFRFEASLKTWIYRITVNTTLNFRRKRSTQRERIKEYRENARVEERLIKPSFAEGLDHQNRIDKLLNALNPDQRMCIILRNIEGLSYEEIAQSLRIKINTVRTRLKRAREKLLLIKQEVVKDEV